MQRCSARCARLLGAAAALLTLVGCASVSDGEAGLSTACTAQGLTPGTEAFATCVEGQRLQQQRELERIRQAREAARGGTKL